MSEKVVLIVGGGSGIGKATALAAVASGFRTVATVQNERQRDELAAALTGKANARIEILDVTDFSAVTSSLERVKATEKRLDGVIHVAGVTSLGTVEQMSIEAFDRVMKVNFFGVLHVLKNALPLLRASKGRSLTVTSFSGVIGLPYSDAYSASKFATEGLLESLAPVVGQHGVKITVIEPGPVKTDILETVNVDRDIINPSAPYMAPRDFLLSVLGSLPEPQTAEEVAEVIMSNFNEPNPPFRVQTSSWARETMMIKLRDIDGAETQNLLNSWVSR